MLVMDQSFDNEQIQEIILKLTIVKIKIFNIMKITMT